MNLTISTIKSIFKSNDLLLNEDEIEIEDFSNNLTILDHEDNKSDEKELLEQPENNDDEVIDLMI
jgi:hypothetical protein